MGKNVEVVKFFFLANGDQVLHERLKNALIQQK